MRSSIAAVLAAVSLASAATINETEPSITEINKAAATTLPYSPVSNVSGLAFDRIIDIWLENVDYATAAADPNMQAIAKEGILLTNYWAVTHPSEPNYCAAASGENFGMDNDNFHQIPNNVSTVADLLDTKGIAWGEYQEGLPYPGFQGFNYSNQQTYANNYVRKHNPLILFNSVTDNDLRLRQIKNFTNFYQDLQNKRLPQWAFVTPNMTNDGHDTNITFAAKWSINWLTPLLKNPYFTEKTLILLTFDESGNYTVPNKVFSVLLGGAVPEHLKGTTDDTFYTHYSVIASVSANWGLPSLGRWDCGANLFKLVAEKTGYVNYEVDTHNLFLNQTYPGPLSANDYSKYSPNWPVPAAHEKCSAGHGILKAVKDTWGHLEPSYNYTAPFPYDTASGINVGVKYYRTDKNGKKEEYVS
ncbi:hypothetical protein VTN96DRAFT_9069 [Rasamsonia emersonii]